jgi:hypothetical protein
LRVTDCDRVAPPMGTAAATADNAVLLTVFPKHDQSRPLGELNAQPEKQGFDSIRPFNPSVPKPCIGILPGHRLGRVGLAEHEKAQ